VNKEILEVKIKKREVNIIVWIIPLISILVAGWLIYKYYSSLGPLITIKFKNSGGLEPKRSVVKFRDVVVGKVEKIKILKNSESVLVYVRMQKEIKPFLNYTTKFWVVKPQIGLNQIRGLDALFSGPYIQMYAQPKIFAQENFRGLDEPPIDSAILNGKILTLTADSTYGLSEKLPVYFKHLKIGTIRKIKISKNAKVKIIISINKKYIHFINDSTKFWNIKKIDISLNKNFLQLSIPTLKELMFGGIVLDTPDKSKTLTKNTFKLFPSKSDAFANTLGSFSKYREFIVKFNKQNSLLTPGEAVKFRGFNVGYIKKVNSFFDINTDKITSYAILDINIGAFMKNKNEKIIPKLLNKGLSVKLTQKFPILESATLNLIFTNKPYMKKTVNGKIELKALYIKTNSTIAKVNKLLDKLNSLPLKRSLNDINYMLETTTPALKETLLSIEKTSNSINKLANNKNIDKLLINSNMLLQNVNKTLKYYSNDSLFYKRVSKTLFDIDKTMNNLNRVIIKIDKKPNSVILGD